MATGGAAKVKTKTELAAEKDSTIADGVMSTTNIIDHAAEVLSLRYSPEGDFLCAGDQNGALKIYNMKSVKLQSTLEASSESLTDDMVQTTCTRYYPTSVGNQLIACYSNGHLRVWNVDKKSCKKDLNEQRSTKQTLCLDLNCDATLIATGGTDPAVNVYDAQTLTTIKALNHTQKVDQMDGHVSRVFSICFHPLDPSIFISAGWDGTIQFWDVRQASSFKRIFGVHVCGDSIDIHPTGSTILSGSYRAENPIQLWNYNTCELMSSFGATAYEGTSQIYAAQYITKELIVVGGAATNRLKVYDINNLESVGSITMLRNAVYAIDCDRVSSKPHKMAACSGNQIYLVNVKKPKQIYQV